MARSIVKATTTSDMSVIGYISGPPFLNISHKSMAGIGASSASAGFASLPAAASFSAAPRSWLAFSSAALLAADGPAAVGAVFAGDGVCA